MSLPFPAPTAVVPSRAEVFLGYLDYFRSRLVDKLQALPEDELRRSRLPSGWAPIELLKHLCYVELRWLEWGFEGRAVTGPWGDSRNGRQQSRFQAEGVRPGTGFAAPGTGCAARRRRARPGWQRRPGRYGKTPQDASASVSPAVSRPAASISATSAGATQRASAASSPARSSPPVTTAA